MFGFAWELGGGASHHNEAPRNKSCGKKTVSRAFNAQLIVRTQNKSYFSRSLQWFFTMLLHFVRIGSKNTQDVSFHAFPMDKKGIPRCLVMVSRSSPPTKLFQTYQTWAITNIIWILQNVIATSYSVKSFTWSTWLRYVFRQKSWRVGKCLGQKEFLAIKANLTVVSKKEATWQSLYLVVEFHTNLLVRRGMYTLCHPFLTGTVSHWTGTCLLRCLVQTVLEWNVATKDLNI